ncbi:glycosyl transferase domain protein [Neisseria meningitidis NM045]|nr:glycosyl transferase domain protein [Neisseria meningitidis NM045]
MGCGTFHRVGGQPDDRSRRMARQTCRPAPYVFDKAYASKMAQKAVCQILTQDLLTGQAV